MSEEKCMCCGLEDIKYVKRGLGKRCYYNLRAAGKLESFPNIKPRLPYRPHKIKDNDMFVSDMYELITNNNGTLEGIASKHNCSRQNVEQLFERIFGFKYTVIKKAHSSNRKREALSKYLQRKDPRYKLEIYSEGGPRYKGAVSERAVFDICEKLSYDVKPYLKDHSIDLIVNGYLVEIKSSYTAKTTTNGSKTPLYHFVLSKLQKCADFVVCHAVPINKFFIIPRNEFSSSGHIYIPEKMTSTWETENGGFITKTNHWYKYLDAWDLLRPKEQEHVFTAPQAVAI